MEYKDLKGFLNYELVANTTDEGDNQRRNPMNSLSRKAAMSKAILVDIDNTLWDFATVLYERLREVNPSIPPPDFWHHWDFWEDYMDAEIFYQVVNGIHSEQDRFGVYPEAPEFLKGLKSEGYRIIVSSHRDPSTEGPTLRWLEKHGLMCDELILTYNKTELFFRCSVVVDDSPKVLSRASELGILASGLEFPWNRGNGFRLFKNLFQVLEFVTSNW